MLCRKRVEIASSRIQGVKSFDFTLNELGINLCPKQGPWRYFKTLDLERGRCRIDLDVDEALANIPDKGFHIVPADVTFALK